MNWMFPGRNRAESLGNPTNVPAELYAEPLEARWLLSGTWTSLATPVSLGTMLTLPDGTLMAQGTGQTNAWYRLTPDAQGSYTAGSWSPLASMSQSRLHFGSAILPDGRVVVLGGELSSAGANTSTGEVYDPVANTWTAMASFPEGGFGDGPLALLPDGTILAGSRTTVATYRYTPATNSWAATGDKIHGDVSSEETWTLLPDGDILSYDINASITNLSGSAQRYDFATATWGDAGTLTSLLSTPSEGARLGGAVLLPDGRVWQLGGNSQSAYYDPATNTWTSGPIIPGNRGADNAPLAITPDGLVLFTADTPISTTPTEMYEFDPRLGTITDITTTLPGTLQTRLSLSEAHKGRMALLPTGQLAFSPDNLLATQLYFFQPDLAPNNAWRPTITTIVDNGGGNFLLTGTQLTGISAGAGYGNEARMDSNYPLIQLTATNGSGNVYYARSSNWTPAVATGATAVTTEFTIPATVPAGVYNVRVVTNGISSDPYLLSTIPALTVVSSIPANNGVVAFPTSTVTIEFNLPVDTATLDPADLTVNGIPADTVVYDSLTQSASFTFLASPVVAEGPQALALATDAIFSATGLGLLAYSATYYYDTLELAVVTTNPAPGAAFTIPAATFVYEVTWNEPIDPASLSVGDLVLSQGSVVAVTVLPGNTVAQFTLTGFTRDGAVDISLPADAVQDAYGNPDFAGFFATYQIDANGTPLPTPLTPVLPLGSLIYRGAEVGVINDASDVDSFTIDLEAGQLVTVTIETDAALQGTVSLLDPSSTVLASAAAAVAGDTLVLQTVPAVTGGIYTIQMAGLASTLGDYTVRILLNAQTELEPTNGVANDSSATAEPLGPSFVSVGAVGFAGDRAGVYGSFNGNDDYYSLTLNVGEYFTAGTQVQTASSGSNFLSPTTLSGFAGPTSLASGDFNEDGIDDLVVTNDAVATVSVLLATGAGTFAAATTYAMGSLSAWSVKVGDINGDDHLDLVTIDALASQVFVRIGNGDGTFQGATAQSVGYTPLGLEVADLDGDDLDDVITANFDGNSISLLQGQAAGTLDVASTYLLSFIFIGISDVVVADVNNDSSPDIITSNYSSDTIAVLLNDGTGAPTLPSYYAMGFGPWALLAQDFNGDDNVDIVTANFDSTNISVILGDGSGTFASSSVEYSTGGDTPIGLASGDFDQNGTLDLVVANGSSNNVAVMLNDGNAVFVLQELIPTGATPYGVAVGNFDGDSSPDFATPNFSANTVSVSANSDRVVRLQLLNDLGEVVADGVSADNFTDVIAGYIPDTTGTYYLRVFGAGQVDYSLVATRRVAFETEPNDDTSSATYLGGTTGVLGHVTGTGVAALFGLQGKTADGQLILAGDKITLGIATDGSFITNDSSVGIQYNGTEFVTPGAPVASFTVAYGGQTYTNNMASGYQDIDILSIQDISYGAVLGARIVGMAGTDLLVERVVVFRAADSYVTIATRLTNVGTLDLTGVATMESLDPDQDEQYSGNFSTENDVVLGGQLVWARGPDSGLTIGIGSTAANSVTSAEGFTNTDPFAILTSPDDPNAAEADIAIAQAFDVGTLLVGGQFFDATLMVFGTSSADVETLFGSVTITDVADDDWYTLQLSPTQTIVDLSTVTPGDGPGEFVNTLNPHVELYDATGTILIATGTLQPDGRNESIYASGLTGGGIYRIKVSAETATTGEYVLNVITYNQARISAGQVTGLTDVWQTVTLPITYVDPIVIVGPLGEADIAPANVRIRNVTGTSFEIRVDEWDYLDGVHAAESASYFVLERGLNVLDNRKIFVAGSVDVTQSGAAFQSVNYGFNFGINPVVMASVATDNGAESVNSRIRSVTRTGFQVRIQEQESADQIHVAETVNYIATLPGLGRSNGLTYEVANVNGVSSRSFSYRFTQTFSAAPSFVGNLQTYNFADPNNVRLRSKTARIFQPVIQEEQSLDLEVVHGSETLGYMAFRYVAPVPFAPVAAARDAAEFSSVTTFAQPAETLLQGADLAAATGTTTQWRSTLRALPTLTARGTERTADNTWWRHYRQTPVAILEITTNSQPSATPAEPTTVELADVTNAWRTVRSTEVGSPRT